MSRVCILTDSTALFPDTSFTGRDLVHVLPFSVELNGRPAAAVQELRPEDLPPSARDGVRPTLCAPSVETFHRTFNTLSQKYPEIAVILISAQLSPAVERAQQTLHLTGPGAVEVIDSQTTAAGLGWLVQAAAEAAYAGASLVAIRRLVHTLSTRIYTLFCVHGLTYLSQAGLLDVDQALVGEMLGLTPVFSLEGGRLAALHKPRSPHQVVDQFIEYLVEFQHLKRIVLLQGAPAFNQETRSLRARLQSSFPGVGLCELAMSSSLAALLGPRCLGLTVME